MRSNSPCQIMTSAAYSSAPARGSGVPPSRVQVHVVWQRLRKGAAASHRRHWKNLPSARSVHRTTCGRLSLSARYRSPFRAISNTSKLRNWRDSATFAYASFNGREKIR
jgi:hypothetical protein